MEIDFGEESTPRKILFQIFFGGKWIFTRRETEGSNDHEKNTVNRQSSIVNTDKLGHHSRRSQKE